MFRRDARFARLAVSAVLAGCQGGSLPNAPVVRSTATSGTSATADVACDPSHCADDTSRIDCASGVPRKESCGSGAMCLAGGCVSLTTEADGAPIDAGRVREVGGAGWINAWSGVTPVPKKLADAYLASGDPAPLGGREAFHAFCAPDGYVVPRPRPFEKGLGQILSVATSFIVSSRAQKVDLAVGISGHLTVAVDGNVVLDESEAKGIGKRAWPDEHAVAIDLKQGTTRVSVMLEAPTSADRLGGFYLRLRAPDGSVAPQIGVAEAFAQASCTSGELANLAAKLELDESGLGLVWHPTFDGVVPNDRAKDSLGFTVEVTGANGARTDVPWNRAGERVRIATLGPADVNVAETEKLGTPADHPLYSAHVPAYGTLTDRVAKLVAGIARANQASIPDGSRASYEEHARSLARLLGQGDDDLPFLERHTHLAETLLEKIDGGIDPYADLTGPVYRAYRSPLDGRLTSYVAYVPPSQKNGKPQPLVIISHGRNRSPEHALRTLVGEAPDDHMTLRFAARNWPYFVDQRAILVAPLSFDEGGAHPLGEEDVLDVIGEMEKAYKVDPHRVSLTGYSLGGTVAFVLPLHYPDVFSSSAPLCGYPNLMSYESIATVKHRAPWEDALLAKKYIVNYAENGLHVPLQIVHGGKDTPERSQVVADRYKDLGYSVNFDVQDDLDHNVWDYGYKEGRMITWLTQHERPAAPKHVKFVTGEYRYDRAYWLRVIGMNDSCAQARASVDAKLDEKAKKVSLVTANVDALAIDRSVLASKDAFASGFAIDADGKALDAPAGVGPLYLVKNGQWSIADNEPSRAGMKRHGVSGPISDVLHHAIVVVYGTKDPAHRFVNQLVANELATAGLGPDVEYPVTTSYPILADTDATDDALKGKSVVLVGSPADNAITERYAPSLPVTFEAGAIVVRGTKFAGKGVGVSFIAPRPDDAAEYVVVHAGLDADGTLASRSLPRYLPDWVVYDERINVERGGLIFDKRPYVAGGFWDESWK